MAQKMINLTVPALPCPFCMERKLRISTDKVDGMDVVSVVCMKCFADGPCTSDPERAVELWNERVIPPQVEEAIKELQARRDGTWTETEKQKPKP